MSFQQNINQMLGNVTIGAGLYAHTPEGQRFGRTQTLKRDINKLTKIYNKEKTSAPEAEAINNLILDRFHELEKISPLTKLNPQAGGLISSTNERQSVAEHSEDIYRAKAKQKKDAEMNAIRRSILEGTPSDDLPLEKERLKGRKAIQSAETKDVKNVQKQNMIRQIRERERVGGGLVLGPYESEGPGGERLETRIFGSIPTQRARLSFSNEEIANLEKQPKGGK